MRCYRIGEKLELCDEAPGEAKGPLVRLYDKREWERSEAARAWPIAYDSVGMDIRLTKAEASFDHIAGTFSLPRRATLAGPDDAFAFFVHARGVTFVDDTGRVGELLGHMAASKKWRLPCVERFVSDFLSLLVQDDHLLLERYESTLACLERRILRDKGDMTSTPANAVRSDTRILLMHYAQLLDVAEVLEENENGFFVGDRLRYFGHFAHKVERLRDMALSVHDYTMQTRDLYKMHLDLRQNNIVTLLTVVTAIFTPLTLLTGWFGMNFEHMPELEGRWSYLAVIAVSLLIVAVEVAYFRRKRWL